MGAEDAEDGDTIKISLLLHPQWRLLHNQKCWSSGQCHIGIYLQYVHQCEGFKMWFYIFKMTVDREAAIPWFWCCNGSKQSIDISGSSIAGWWRDPQKTSPWRRRGMPTTCAVHYCRRAPQTRTGWQRLPSWRLRLRSPDLYYYWYCLSS